MYLFFPFPTNTTTYLLQVLKQWLLLSTVRQPKIGGKNRLATLRKIVRMRMTRKGKKEMNQ
jgi:hypothetical protein